VPDENAMKVQCGQCPAKYAVSDERIHDKKVRIHCKRCGASIVVDGKVNPPLVTSTPARPSVRPGDSLPPLEAPLLAERAPASERSPRPVAHTIVGGLEAPAERAMRLRSMPESSFIGAEAPAANLPGMPAPGRGMTDPPGGAEDSRWRVALTKQDLRWMTTAEIIQAYHAGAVKLETFVFRSGMPTWVTLLEVPEIAEALAEAGEELAELDSLVPASPSSLPPPRRNVPRTPLREAPVEEEDAGETVPFALVAERANAGPSPRAQASAASDIVTSAPVREAASPARAQPAASLEPVPADLAGPPAFAAAQQASGGGGRWIWAVVVVVVLGAAAMLLPRLGVHLF
jgi:predicted Zn finger-like uncharacterized protein